MSYFSLQSIPSEKHSRINLGTHNFTKLKIQDKPVHFPFMLRFFFLKKIDYADLSTSTNDLLMPTGFSLKQTKKMIFWEQKE